VSHRGYVQNINLSGIDPVLQMKVTNMADDITHGNLKDLNNGNSLVFMGERLMKFLGVRVNDMVNISTSDGRIMPMKVIGTFDTGDRRSDERVIYASIPTVQNATGTQGEISSIVVKLKDHSRATELADKWKNLSRDRVESWDQLNSDRLSMMSTQDIVRNVTTMAFIIIVAFGIYNILNMVVTHKMKDIAILRSIGYTQGDTVFLFLVQGVLLGITGALAGLAVGAAACAYIETIKIPVGRGHMMISWDSAIYLKAFFLVNGAAVIASYFPARTAGRLSPIDIIRGSI
jgi:lipoprotein-releasing system permease protein